MKTIEVNVGIGMNMFFPETIKIVLGDVYEKRYRKYLRFIKIMKEPDFEYLIDDPNQNKVRKFTFEEFVEEWDNNKKLQKKFK